MKIGFTGTQKGMNSLQQEHLRYLLQAFESYSGLEFHHGDCIGADAEAHIIAREGRWRVVGHPPINPAKRAFCDFDEERAPLDYLDRNHMIVEETDCLIVAPYEAEEQLRSGTWATWRYADKLNKEWIMYLPDGSTRYYR